jgi:hypothetical protein
MEMLARTRYRQLSTKQSECDQTEGGPHNFFGQLCRAGVFIRSCCFQQEASHIHSAGHSLRKWLGECTSAGPMLGGL